MPPTRREQLQLDELLSDIYRGIETLPDSANTGAGSYTTSGRTSTGEQYVARTNVRHYELPASSPIVKQHYRAVQELRAAEPSKASSSNQFLVGGSASNSSSTARQPHKPSLKPSGSAASPDSSRRRVRIVDSRQPKQQQLSQFDTQYVRYSDDDDYNDGNNNDDDGYDVDYLDTSEQQQQHQQQQPRVKFVNENKLIYHDEENAQRNTSPIRPRNLDDDDDNDADSNDELDGVTRVEYYRTSWLDRQLGRVSRRRSSKDLNERQIKEKAMIEELKHNLKNGAISLRQSLTGSKHNNNKQSNNNNNNETNYNSNSNKQFTFDETTNDDQILNNRYKIDEKSKQSSVVSSGLATIPRNKQQKSNSATKNSIYHSDYSTKSFDYQSEHLNPNYTISNQAINPNSETYSHPTQRLNKMRQPDSHSLIQSHYRGNTPNSYATTVPSQHQPHHHQNSNADLYQHCESTTNQRQAHTTSYSAAVAAAANSGRQQQQQQTLSSIPSAREVLRSALSSSPERSNSVQTLNKTINLLPSSPTPVGTSTTCTPTQQLQSPSPQQTQRLTGVRKYPTDGGGHRPQTQPDLHSSVPKSSMSASAREFHELDNLLKSLNPHTVTVTPGYSTQPTKASFGIGLDPQQHQEQKQHQKQHQYQHQHQQQYQSSYNQTNTSHQNSNTNSLYAKIQRPQTQHHYQPQPQQQQTKSLVVDVSDEHKLNELENCRPTQQKDSRQSSNHTTTNNDNFCVPDELLLPSMEDYQNISKLNPVKNHYWYKPNMDRGRAIDLLRDKPQGTFIVRDSTSIKGAFGLALKVSKLPENVLNNAVLRNPSDPSADLIRHFLIEPTAENGVLLKGYANEPVFPNLPTLIYQHSLTELGLPCKLIIPRADIEDPAFIQKQKAYYNEFLKSKEEAKHHIYDRTTPDGGYRKYPGPVYVHNEHRIIFE